MLQFQSSGGVPPVEGALVYVSNALSALAVSAAETPAYGVMKGVDDQSNDAYAKVNTKSRQ
jgi:hypothetical protein